MKKKGKKVAITFYSETYEKIRDYAILLSISEGDLVRNVMESFTLSLRYPGQERNADNARFLVQADFSARIQVFLEEILYRMIPDNEAPGLIEELNRKANKKIEETISQFQILSEPPKKDVEEQAFIGDPGEEDPEKWDEVTRTNG